ncbi:unnamed protein product [Xylocopa violacea]|uniref:Uncharacterized protein n=1 Tax=Xylocopa violacea TaxID=135666 RepID=A0ABP1NSI2_XYLVO
MRQITRTVVRTTKTACITEIMDGTSNSAGIIESYLLANLYVSGCKQTQSRYRTFDSDRYKISVWFATMIRVSSDISKILRIYACHRYSILDIFRYNKNIIHTIFVRLYPTFCFFDTYYFASVLAYKLTFLNAFIGPF